jgi:hypothetical protein
MKPGRNLMRFRDTSDIDVVIVSENHFDYLWLALLAALYPRGPLVERMAYGGWVQQRKNEVYTGWLSPLEIKLDVTIFGPPAMACTWFG